jgi:DHA1 family bicyclomycin/chloramphenicol resistance-like MFS transporter
MRSIRDDPRTTLGNHSLPFTLLLGALATLAAFATDMGLPVLAETAASLGVTPGHAALTLSVFMAGFALGPLVLGPLSDHFGRRPILLTGCAMFAVFGALGAFSTSLGGLLTWRFLMGTGAGGCQVLVLATVRDLFVGTEARVKQAYVNLAGGVAPIIAPTLGVAIAAAGGWRAIYAALAAGGVVLFALVARRLGESAPRRAGATLTVRDTLASYARVLRHPVSLGYALVVALNFGCLFAYVSGSSLVLIELLRVSRPVYGYLFACTAFGLMVGAFATARLTRRGVPHERLIVGGFVLIVATALALLALTLAGRLTVAMLVPLGVVNFVGQGIVRPNAALGALEPMPEIAGIASAVLSGLQMVSGAAASAVVATFFDGRSALAVTGTMAACSVGSAAVYAGLVRRAERRSARVVDEAALAAFADAP